MEQRKVQKVGGASYTLSLPKAWAKKHNLNKGDTIFVDVRDDGTISLMPSDSVREKKRVEIPIASNISLTCRILISKYLEGYDVLKIYAKDRISLDARTKLIEISQNLIGIELFEETSKEMVFSSLVEFGSMGMSKIIRRISVLASSMFSDALRAMKNFDRELAMDLFFRDNEVDKLCFFAMRELSEAFRDTRVSKKLGITKTSEGVSYLVVVKNIERVGDYAVKISQDLACASRELPDSLVSYAKEAKKIYDKTLQSLFRRNIEVANEILCEIEGMGDMENRIVEDLIKKSEKVSDAVTNTSIFASVKGIIRHSANIAEAVINLGA